MQCSMRACSLQRQMGEPYLSLNKEHIAKHHVEGSHCIQWERQLTASDGRALPVFEKGAHCKTSCRGLTLYPMGAAAHCIGIESPTCL